MECKGDIFSNEGSEALEKVTLRSCGCPISGNGQGQVGWGFESCPCPWRVVGLDELRRSPPQPKPLFDYMTLQNVNDSVFGPLNFSQ